MQVMGPDGVAIALGDVKPSLSPPLRVQREYPAVSVTEVKATDVGRAFVFDFGYNMAGTVFCHSKIKGDMFVYFVYKHMR